MPTKRQVHELRSDWFARLPDDALVRELRVLPGPANPAPLVDVGKETLRRWSLEGKAPRPITVGATRHYKVGELRRWLRGEWPLQVGKAKSEAA
jgi:hypothetical protein